MLKSSWLGIVGPGIRVVGNPSLRVGSGRETPFDLLGRHMGLGPLCSGPCPSEVRPHSAGVCAGVADSLSSLRAGSDRRISMNGRAWLSRFP